MRPSAAADRPRMHPTTPPTARAWIVVLALAVGFVLWADSRHLGRLDHFAAISRGDSVVDAGSPTGYAGGVRERVLPDHDGNSYAWIAQTQQMLARGEWRVRHLDTENAPFGRDVHAASPYSWWLGLVASGRRLVTGEPTGLAVENAARFANPLLQILILLGLTPEIARQFGALAASLFAAGAALLFPLAAGFSPGTPDDISLRLLVALGSVLPLLTALRALDSGDRTAAGRGLGLAGVAGGIGLWLAPAAAIPLLLGVALGALGVARLRRPAAELVPWRAWSVSGAITVLLASLVEYFPSDLGSWELRAVHPLYGLSWLGGGEILLLVSKGIQLGWKRPTLMGAATAGLSALALAALPVAMWRTGNPGFLAADISTYRLTNQGDSALAANLLVWLREDGASAAVVATLLPLLLVVPAVVGLLRRAAPHAERSLLAVALGPVLAAVVFAALQLHWWMLADALLLVLIVAATAGTLAAPKRWLWIGGASFVLLFGFLRVLPTTSAPAGNTLSLTEAQGIMERDLAHWLARRAVGNQAPVVHAPPALTTTLAYYGGIRGLGSLSWESREGLAVAVRVAISTSRDEALALLRRREVTHLVLTSWDGFFDAYTRASSMQLGELFYVSLNRWRLPLWLRPLPYQGPKIPGMESRAVRILEVVDDQDEPLAAARLTEYFIEMGQLDNAQATRPGLLRYPADLGVLVARAQLEIALQDGAAFTAILDPLVNRVAGGASRNLNWERRVSLAVVLAKGQHLDLARVQVQRCLVEANAIHLRSLTTNELFYLLALKKNFGLTFTDPRLQALALQLLPQELLQSL